MFLYVHDGTERLSNSCEQDRASEGLLEKIRVKGSALYV